MRRPFVILAVPYVAGLWVGDFVEPIPVLALGGSLLLALATLALRRLRTALLPALLFLTAWTNLGLRTAALSPVDLRIVTPDSAAWMAIRGTLLQTPEERITALPPRLSARTPRDTNQVRSLAILSVSAIRLDHEWRPASGMILATTPGRLPSGFWGGATVETRGVLEDPARPAAPGLFDYRTYLARRGIYRQLRVESTNDWHCLHAPNRPPWPDRFQAWARRVLALGLPAEDEAVQLQWAMVLGWKTALTSEVSAPFMRSGTMHVFAISGLHVALIAYILVALLRVVRVPRAACGAFAIPGLWCYTAATGWQASAVRSTVMMTIVIAGWSLRRPSDLLNSLAGAACVILLADPQQLFQASFQLSFFVVLSLALVTPPIRAWFDRWTQPDPLLPRDLQPGWRRRFDRPIQGIAHGVTTSVAAWLGSLPIVAAYFNLVTPVSILANLLIVPLSGLALACGLGSLVCGGWFPSLAILFNHSGWFWMTGMLRLSEWAADLPGAWFHVPAPGPATFVLYYALLAGLLTGWVFKRQHWVWAALALSLIGLGALVHSRIFPEPWTITVLPLRGGDSLWVAGPGTPPRVLIDAGDDTAAEFVVRPFLQAQGVNCIPAAVLSHGDLRHVGGFLPLSQAFRIEEAWCSPLPFRSAAYGDTLAQLPLRATFVTALARGDQAGPFEVLHPTATDQYALADDGALVLRTELNGWRILLCSDLGRRGQRALLAREPVDMLRADVVVASIPTHAEPLEPAFFRAADPRVIVLSAGDYPPGERPTRTLLARLNDRGATVFCTRDDGAVVITVRPNRCIVENMDGRRAELTRGTR